MNNFFNEYHELLYNCNKPYQYVGGEFLSRNKNFDEAKVTFAFAFPDKYEIGISNLGQRVLYGLINNHLDFMADRVYAPEVDFKDNLIKSGKDFYSLESKRPLKDFDIIGFSLQYELSYPTVLAMMEMAKIPVRSSVRGTEDPIILAGGPCAYNPLPLSAFVDAFLIGDGEDVILEVCEAIKGAKAQALSRREKLEKLAEIEGVFVPGIYYNTPSSGFQPPSPARGEGNTLSSIYPSPLAGEGVNESALSLPPSPLAGEEEFFGEPASLRNSGEGYKKVKKRIAQINYDNALKAYPIPFSSSVHDRAIIEIRRGCGRMCRFCQPGHVNLPVRERSAEDIIKIAKELVQNTGYDEYSLLSLSSNDYSNIKEVIKELALDFNDKKVSVSLPSQRIDGFNLELANLVQSVRKSTMTLAPEAGSQRLRDVIRKNITKEQILDAALTLYENGWSRIKFYFIVGLPTETYEDLDEMAELLAEIRHKSRYIKKLKELKHSLDITCTLSIFVPKPFTPFQWFGQMNIDEVMNRIHYLKDKTKPIKGLKINYHDKFTSQIEAVLTRGDAKLCDYIEKLWQKGCYLDAWGEYFDKDVWRDTAQELGISLEELAEKEYPLEDDLPWDFIDIGVDKKWLVQEYCDALKSETKPACETGCVNCGVCGSFKTHKVMDAKYEGKNARGQEGELSLREASVMNSEAIQNENPSIKYRIKLTKTGILRYFSHLDWQNTFLKALARTGLNIAFSQGFNPSMKVSLGVALPLFAQSECELADIEIIENPIISINCEKLYGFDNEKDLRKAAIDYYKKNIQGKNVQHETLGKINFAKQGISKTKNTSSDIRKLISVYKLDELILTAKYERTLLSYKENAKFIKYHYLTNRLYINEKKFDCRITIGENGFGKTFYNINDILYHPPSENEQKNGPSTFTDGQTPGVDEPTCIITNPNINFKSYGETSDLQLKLQKVMPQGCEILSVTKMDKSVQSIDISVQWALYEIKLFENSLHKFSDLRYNIDKVLSSEEVLLTKKNKKGILKTTNIKNSIKSYDFEKESLFIVLKTGQSAEIAALRADDLMQILAPDILFDIKRVKFFDGNFEEL